MERFCLLFDLDGTLVDSVPDLAAAANAVLRECGLRALAHAEVRGMVGDGVAALVARALAAAGGDPGESPTVLPRFLDIYEANATRLTRPYPGVPETLAVLRRRGYGLGVCTNKPQEASLIVLGGLGLLPFFDGLAGGDRFAVKKPAPDHLLGLLAELGGRPERAAVIGDSDIDAAAAKAAGLPLLLMRYGYAHSDPDQLGATALLDDFAELPPTLERLGLGP